MRLNDYYSRIVYPARSGRPTIREAGQDFRRSLEAMTGAYHRR